MSQSGGGVLLAVLQLGRGFLHIRMGFFGKHFAPCVLLYPPHQHTLHEHNCRRHGHIYLCVVCIHFLFADFSDFLVQPSSLLDFLPFCAFFSYLFIRARQRKALLSSGAPRRNYLATPALLPADVAGCKTADGGWRRGPELCFSLLFAVFSRTYFIANLSLALPGVAHLHLQANGADFTAHFPSFSRLCFPFPFASRLQHSSSVHLVWFRFSSVGTVHFRLAPTGSRGERCDKRFMRKLFGNFWGNR